MNKPTLQQLDKAFSEYVNGWGRAKDFVEAVVKQWWYTMEELWNPVFDNEWNLTSNDYNKWWDEQPSNETPIKEDASSKEDVENKEKPETEVDNEKIKQLKEEQASIDAKAYADKWRKEYEDNLTKEEWDETSGKSNHKRAQFWDVVVWDLSKYAPVLYSYFEKNPWEAAKLIEKVKDVNALWEGKLLNFLDNLWGRLWYWMDKWNGSFKSSVIWTDKRNPFQWWAKSSELKDITRWVKTTWSNPWVMQKTVWTASKNSNAFSNLSTAQKIQWWLQLFWMAMAALDWWLKVSDDMDSWVMKEDSNEFVERLYMFSNYLDKALTDMIPGVWLGNAIYNVVMEDKKDDNWLSKGRWGLLTKLWLDFWTEKDADKRKQNKDTVDWMQDEWYTKNWIPIYNWFKPASTGKWTPARFAEEQAKAIEKMQTMWWTDQYWNTADNAATRYIVQYNKASWSKNYSSDKTWSLSALTKSDMLKNYKWKKQDDWSYDWVNKKTGLSLSNEVQWLSESTWNKYPTFEEDNANREKWIKIEKQKEDNKKNWRNLINWTKEKMKEKYNPWDTINI